MLLTSHGVVERRACSNWPNACSIVSFSSARSNAGIKIISAESTSRFMLALNHKAAKPQPHRPPPRRRPRNRATLQTENDDEDENLRSCSTRCVARKMFAKILPTCAIEPQSAARCKAPELRIPTGASPGRGCRSGGAIRWILSPLPGLVAMNAPIPGLTARANIGRAFGAVSRWFANENPRNDRAHCSERRSNGHD